METAKAEIGKPFPQEEELREKSARLAQLNTELNIDERMPLEAAINIEETEQSNDSAIQPKATRSAVNAKAERTSVLAQLRAPLPQRNEHSQQNANEKEER